MSNLCSFQKCPECRSTVTSVLPKPELTGNLGGDKENEKFNFSVQKYGNKKRKEMEQTTQYTV